jgi:hypothetical protein
MPMVQISHARLSSLVCDGNKRRGKIVVGVAAHYSLTTSRFKGAPRQPKKRQRLCLLLFQADVNHFLSPSSAETTSIDVYIYARLFVGTHALLVFRTRGTNLRDNAIDTMKENNTYLVWRRDTIQLVIILASNDT